MEGCGLPILADRYASLPVSRLLAPCQLVPPEEDLSACVTMVGPMNERPVSRLKCHVSRPPEDLTACVAMVGPPNALARE